MATGALIGGLLGTVGGAFAGNPALGYSLGSSLGGVVEGAALMGNANRKGLQANDPRTRLLYDEIVNKRKALETGQMYQPQQDMITQAGARAMNTAAGITGGDIGGTVSALSSINRGTGRNLNELYGNMMNQSNALLQQQAATNQLLYNWNYARQAYDQQQSLAHASQTMKDAMSNLNAVMMKFGGRDDTDNDNTERKRQVLNFLQTSPLLRAMFPSLYN